MTALKLPLLRDEHRDRAAALPRADRDAGLDGRARRSRRSSSCSPPPITAAHFLTANGGNVEPCLYVLLLWLLRRRPIWFGLVLGVGFLNREFTIYGAGGAARARGRRGARSSRATAARRYGIAFATAARRLDRLPRAAAFLLGGRSRHVHGGPRGQLAGNNLLAGRRAAVLRSARDRRRRGPHLHGPLARAFRPRAAAADRLRDRERRPPGPDRQRLAARPGVRHSAAALPARPESRAPRLAARSPIAPIAIPRSTTSAPT